MCLKKTKLLIWTPPSLKPKRELLRLNCPVKLNSEVIEYSDSAEHVGVVRSVAGGSMPNILDRISSHRRALASVLPVGAALHHKANPTATLLLEKLYGCPVLLSGLAALVLSAKEIGVVNRHYKLTLCRLQKLPLTTPDCVIYFLAGSLPASVLLHQM